jgi:prefoldin subunit 5
MPEEDSAHRSSDAPPPDLSRERDELLRNFSKASQLTRDFLRAYDQIQSQVVDLQAENARLRATLEADDAARDLLSKIQALEAEKQQLLNRVAKVPAETHPSLQELEVELANFANLHVATNCLHSTLSPRGVMRRIKEILEQLVGVEAYVIYLCGNVLTPIVVEGLHEEDSVDNAPRERLNEVVHSGVSSVLDDLDPSCGTISRPPALIPLSIDDKVVGVLAIVRALRHKHQLNTIDFEIFKLMGQHAAAALMAAGLYAQAGRNLPTPEAFAAL